MTHLTASFDASKVIKMARYETMSSTLFHTRYFFKKLYSRKFVVNSHHKQICDLLDRIIKGEVTKAMINIAPRYGKTELAVKSFVSHGLALNPSSKYIHLSYSDDLALDNSEGIKSIVEHESYQEVYPEVKIKKDSRSKKKWYTEQGGGVYATSAAGQVTGFGAGRVDDEDIEDDPEFEDFLTNIGINEEFGGALIIDDPIKPEDADSEAKRDKINNRYNSTIKNRVNSRKTPIIIIMQRLHEDDLCGHLLKNEPGEWEVLSLPCIFEDEEGNEQALWPFKHTLKELQELEDQDPIVFGRQYRQNPQPLGGYLYTKPWKTYDVIPNYPTNITKTYTDTADDGEDYLCSVSYIETDVAMYVQDIIYTQQPMETTENLVAHQINAFSVNIARVESNNGGKGFARAVEEKCIRSGNYRTSFEWFHQSGNKASRIFNNSSAVQNLVHFPSDWEKRWPKFSKHIKSYMVAGKNKHDDAEDVLTGMAEYFGLDNTGLPISALSL